MKTEQLAASIRWEALKMTHRSGAAHTGSCLSCADILAALYSNVLAIDPKEPENPDRDRCILSKGHAAPALYAVLALKGFFPRELLETYLQDGSSLAEHPAPKCQPGVEAATGSLGHGLGIGLGMAYAAHLAKKHYHIYIVMSDGECNEGSVWESAMLAPSLGLNNITVIVDYNKWQATGRSQQVMALDPLAKKWESFNWSSTKVDGHNISALTKTLLSRPGKPHAIIANTVKGKGVSFMEDDNNWHYRAPNEEELQYARQELGV